MKIRQYSLVTLIILFLSTGCIGGSGDDAESATHEPPENAMDEETKQEFDQLMEEYQRTGKIPDKLSEMSSVPEEEPTDDNTTTN